MKKTELRVTFLKALAHPYRLEMVEKLLDGEQCVCELNKIIPSNLSTVSKHLSVLKNAGIVKCEKRGLQKYYSLRVNCLKGFLSCVDDAMTKNLTEDLNFVQGE